MTSVSSSVLWETILGVPFRLCLEMSLNKVRKKVHVSCGEAGYSSSNLLVFMVLGLFLQQTLSPCSEVQTGSQVALAWGPLGVEQGWAILLQTALL